MKVVCAGDCGIDLYLPSGETRVGGITANVARHARNLFPAEDSVDVVSCVGDDPGGERVLAALKAAAIGCRISRVPGRTPVQRIEIDRAGERGFKGYHQGVLQDFQFDADQRQAIAGADLLVSPVFLQIESLFDELMRIPCDGKIAVDFADFAEHADFGLLERWLDRIDIGFFGLSESHAECIERIGTLAAQTGKLLIVTLAAAGSRAFSGDCSFEQTASGGRKVVDTTGAGDAFAAAFLAQYIGHGAGIPAAMTAAASLAGEVVGYFGSYGH